MSRTTRQLALATSICALWLTAGGCTDRVIGSGEYRCDTDQDCSWGWRCLVIAGGDKACVDTGEPTGGDALVIGSDGSLVNDGGPGADGPAQPSGACGDGVLQPGEGCDEGPLNSRLPDAPCRPGCTPAICGDGVIDSGEQCDGDEGCSASCTLTTAATLAADPPALHFGAVGLGCGPAKVSRELRLFYGELFGELTVETLGFEGTCDAFSLETKAPLVVAASEAVTVTVSLTPKTEGLLDNCRLKASTSDGAVLYVPLTAAVGPKLSQTDRLLQRASRKVDILFAIDPSGSMADERSRLMATAPAFATAAAKATLDFHLGSISIVEPSSTSGPEVFGELHGEPRYITSDSTDLIAEFKTRIDMFASGGIERAIDAIDDALSPALTTTIDPGGCKACAAPNICVSGACRRRNWGFRRRGASLEILVVSDEADGSTLAPAALLAKLRGRINPLLGQSVRVHGLLPFPGDGSACSWVEVTPTWDLLIKLGGGERVDICAEDYVPPITAITDKIFGLRRQFFLTRPAKAETVKASVDGQSPAFTYHAESGSVIFDKAPADGATVTLTYEAVCP